MPRGALLETPLHLVDTFVDEIGEISTKLVKGPKTPDAQRGYYIELLNSLIGALPFMSGDFHPAQGPIQLLEDLKNLELGRQSKRLKVAEKMGRPLDIAKGNFRGEVMAAVSFLTRQFKNEARACKWMAHKLEPYANNRLAHVIPSNAHNLKKTLKPEQIRRWWREFKKMPAVAPPKSRNWLIGNGYRTAIRSWALFIDGRDVEGIKSTLGVEKAARFIVDHIILATRDTRDPEESYEDEE